MRQSKDPAPALTAIQLETILSLIRKNRLKKAYYVGYAEKPVIQGLAAALGSSNVSIKDMDDRWGCEARFWWDEEDYGGLKAPRRPEWLEGIATYFEGAPAHDALLCDSCWRDPNDFRAIVESAVRAPPRIVVLWGRAHFVDEVGGIRPFAERHPFYNWEVAEGLLVGRIKDSVETEYDKRDKPAAAATLNSTSGSGARSGFA
jgi:hypothetical protein